jgi:uncharacterized cofD-like protein
MSRKNIVVIGGGTGTFTVLQALRDTPVNLTAIVSTADNGGSAGILRDELGVLPPGDFRQALIALSDDSHVLRELFTYRYTEGGLKGHSFGNLFISTLEKVTGSFDKAILEAGKILNIHGRVLPVTTDQMHLRAATEDGQVVQGEHAIEEHIWSEGSSLQRFWVEPPCTIHPLARQALLEADLIVIAPGSLYTSLVPNFLVSGVTEALQAAKAPLVCITNLMTEKGQGGQFFVQDFVEQIECYIGSGRVRYALYNTKTPHAGLLERYQRERERMPVKLDRRRRKVSYQLVGANLLPRRISAEATPGDELSKSRTYIRHDGAKLSRALTALLYIQEAKKYLKHA